MVSLDELPHDAVRRVSKLARGLLIEGCNRFACICKQWRDADHASIEEQPLQLFMDLQHVSDADVSKLCTWMSVHGHQVDALVIQASYTASQQHGLLWGSAAALRSLTRLEVSHKDSLALLAPVLGQLPQLQCLAADITMTDMDMFGQWQQFDSTFSVEGEPWLELPDIQQLCPRLQDLRLTFTWADVQGGFIDQRLPQLLPCQLKQLVLVYGDYLNPIYDPPNDIYLRSTSLVHLLALQELTLYNITPADGEFLDHLTGLQQLRGHWLFKEPSLATLQLFASKLVALSLPNLYIPQLLPQCTRLTQLLIGQERGDDMSEALAALPGLRNLFLYGWEETEWVPFVRQAADMAQLRSLHLCDLDDVQELGESLAQCTQLSSLYITGCSDVHQQDERVCPGLQQLTGLRSLVVPAGWLACCSGTWLVALSQLTRLQLSMPNDVHSVLAGLLPTPDVTTQEQAGCVYHAAAQRLLQMVQQWPAGLRHVVFWVEPHGVPPPAVKPRCWELAPAVPGGAGVQVWLEQRSAAAAAAAWCRPFKPCPYFPGVWELQGLVDGTST